MQAMQKPRLVGLVLASVALLAVVYFLVVRPMSSDNTESARGTSGRTSVAKSAQDTSAPSLANNDNAPKLDCKQPKQAAARVDDDTIFAEKLCPLLQQTGGANPRVILDRIIDDILVERALAAAGVSVSDADVAAAAKAFGAEGEHELVRTQLRERLELEKLASPPAVSEAEVDTELAAGAPGIDRGQGIKVEGWLLRIPPNADDEARASAERAAREFVTSMKKDADAAAKTHGFSFVQPFVIGQSGLEPELEAAAHGLSKGQVSGAIKTRVGWMVIRMLEIEEGGKLDTKELRARVRKALETRRVHAATKDVLSSLRSAATIDVLVQL